MKNFRNTLALLGAAALMGSLPHPAQAQTNTEEFGDGIIFLEPAPTEPSEPINPEILEEAEEVDLAPTEPEVVPPSPIDFYNLGIER